MYLPLDSQSDARLKSLARSVKNVAEAEAIVRALQRAVKLSLGDWTI
jgi:hypothetical protein